MINNSLLLACLSTKFENLLVIAYLYYYVCRKMNNDLVKLS